MFLLTVLKLNHVLGQHSIENIEFTEKPNLDDKTKFPDFNNSWKCFYLIYALDIPDKKPTAKK